MSMAVDWAEFAEKCIPVDATVDRLTATQDAFYSGALCLFNKLIAVGDRPSCPTQNSLDEEDLEVLYGEIMCYFKQRKAEA